MAKLHQILAIETGIRAQAGKDLTKAHHGLDKEPMLNGQFREYQPLKEDGLKMPSERQALQIRVKDAIKQSVAVLTKSFDIVATRDWANTKAFADVTLKDGTILLKDAPATYILWMEKQLADLHTFVSKLPTLPADTEWVADGEQEAYRNKHEIKTARTEKVQEPLVLHAPTKEHPAQTQLITRDVIAGYWTTTKYHGGFPVPTVQAMKERVETLIHAFKLAREKANQVEAEEKEVGSAILKYIFG